MKNKVYMEKLPKNCFECPCFRNDIEQCCALDDEDEHFFLDEIDGGNCPLIKVSDTKMYQEGYLQRKFDEEANKINFVLAELEKVQNFVWDMSFDIKGKGAVIRLYDMNCMLKNQREEIEKLRRKNEEKQPNISS